MASTPPVAKPRKTVPYDPPHAPRTPHTPRPSADTSDESKLLAPLRDGTVDIDMFSIHADL